MSINMGGEPTPEEKSVVESNVEIPHVNPYLEKEEQEKSNEYKLELERWQADLDAKVAKMRADGEDEQTIELFIEYSPKPERKKEESVMEKEKREVETMLADFEKNHSLEYLNSIEVISPELLKLFKLDQKTEADQIEAMLASVSIEDAIKYKERTSAKNDLIPLVEALKNVYGKEFYQEESYRKLSNAVGVHNVKSGKIRHD